MLSIKIRIYICFVIINVGVVLLQAAVASDVNSQGKNGNLQPHGELRDTSTEMLQKSRSNVWKIVLKTLRSEENNDISKNLALATSREALNSISEEIKKTSRINTREKVKPIHQNLQPENLTKNFKSLLKNLMVLATSRKAQNPIYEEIKTNSKENSKKTLQENNPVISKTLQKKCFVLATSRKSQNPIFGEIKKTSRINFREKAKVIHKNEEPKNLMVLATSRKASNQVFDEIKQIRMENLKDSSENVCRKIVKHVKNQKNFKSFTNNARGLPKHPLVLKNSTETGNLKNVKGFLQPNSSFNVKDSEETSKNLKQGPERLLKETQEQCSDEKSSAEHNLRKFEGTDADLKSSESLKITKLFEKYPREEKHQQAGLTYERHPAYSVEERQTQTVAENRKRSKRQQEISTRNKTLLPFKVLNFKVHQGMNPTINHLYPIFQVLAKSLTLSKLKMMERRFASVRTLVLIGSPPDVLMLPAKIFNYNYPPIVVVTKLSQWKFKDYHNKQIFAIVFLKETFKDSLEILEILTSTLFRLHMRKVLFILPQLDTYERDLVKWCFAKGFWNSLLMDYKGRSLAYDFLAQEYKKNLSIGDFIKSSIYWRDLKGFKVRCLMANNPPRAYIFNNTEGKIDYRGYYGTILSIFAKHYNVTLVPVIPSDLDAHRELDCIEYLQQNLVDLCGDVLAVSFADDYAVTNSEEMTTSMLMVPHDKPLPKYLYFFKPFQLHVWTIVTISFLYKTLTLALIHRLQHGFWNASLQITYATLSVIHLPFNLTQVKGKYRRFLELLLISVGFVVSNWYLAVLSSVLFTSLYHQGIDSLEDLKRYNISIMVNEFEYYQLHTTANHPIIMEQLTMVSNDVLHQHRSNLDMNYAYYNQYDKINLYLYQQKYLLHPRMKVLQSAEPMNAVLGGLPMQTNWPFEHLLNLILRSTIDYGFYLKILEDGMLDGIHQGYIEYFPTEYPTVDPLSIEHFNMPALILLVGYGLALMGFIGEIIVFKIKKKFYFVN